MRSNLLDQDEFPSHYEDRADDISWAKGTLPVSGVFLLHGSYVVAPCHGPAERRLREAGALWAAVTEHRGVAGRDALWDHPDLLPTDEDFADPQKFARAQLDWDISELDNLGGNDQGDAGEKNG